MDDDRMTALRRRPWSRAATRVLAVVLATALWTTLLVVSDTRPAAAQPTWTPGVTFRPPQTTVEPEVTFNMDGGPLDASYRDFVLRLRQAVGLPYRSSPTTGDMDYAIPAGAQGAVTVALVGPGGTTLSLVVRRSNLYVMGYVEPHSGRHGTIVWFGDDGFYGEPDNATFRDEVSRQREYSRMLQTRDRHRLAMRYNVDLAPRTIALDQFVQAPARFVRDSTSQADRQALLFDIAIVVAEGARFRSLGDDLARAFAAGSGQRYRIGALNADLVQNWARISQFIVDSNANREVEPLPLGPESITVARALALVGVLLLGGVRRSCFPPRTTRDTSPPGRATTAIDAIVDLPWSAEQKKSLVLLRDGFAGRVELTGENFDTLVESPRGLPLAWQALAGTPFVNRVDAAFGMPDSNEAYLFACDQTVKIGIAADGRVTVVQPPRPIVEEFAALASKPGFDSDLDAAVAISWALHEGSPLVYFFKGRRVVVVGFDPAAKTSEVLSDQRIAQAFVGTAETSFDVSIDSAASVGGDGAPHVLLFKDDRYAFFSFGTPAPARQLASGHNAEGFVSLNGTLFDGGLPRMTTLLGVHDLAVTTPAGAFAPGIVGEVAWNVAPASEHRVDVDLHYGDQMRWEATLPEGLTTQRLPRDEESDGLRSHWAVVERGGFEIVVLDLIVTGTGTRDTVSQRTFAFGVEATRSSASGESVQVSLDLPRPLASAAWIATTEVKTAREVPEGIWDLKAVPALATVFSRGVPGTVQFSSLPAGMTDFPAHYRDGDQVTYTVSMPPGLRVTHLPPDEESEWSVLRWRVTSNDGVQVVTGTRNRKKDLVTFPKETFVIRVVADAALSPTAAVAASVSLPDRFVSAGRSAVVRVPVAVPSTFAVEGLTVDVGEFTREGPGSPVHVTFRARRSPFDGGVFTAGQRVTYTVEFPTPGFGLAQVSHSPSPKHQVRYTSIGPRTVEAIQTFSEDSSGDIEFRVAMSTTAALRDGGEIRVSMALPQGYAPAPVETVPFGVKRYQVMQCSAGEYLGKVKMEYSWDARGNFFSRAVEYLIAPSTDAWPKDHANIDLTLAMTGGGSDTLTRRNSPDEMVQDGRWHPLELDGDVMARPPAEGPLRVRLTERFTFDEDWGIDPSCEATFLVGSDWSVAD